VDYIGELGCGGARLGVVWVVGFSIFFFLGENRLSNPICTLMVEYRVIIEKDEDGVLVARVPDLPGCATEGKT
jgi:hypothetical protein